MIGPTLADSSDDSMRVVLEKKVGRYVTQCGEWIEERAEGGHGL